jgi:cytochrome c-type biogenesis protein CcmH/NrfG
MAKWTAARDEARAHYAAKRFKQAAESYAEAARYNPTHAGTFAGLGAARLQISDARGAVQAYQKAIQLSPTTTAFHISLGKAYALSGEKGKALTAYKRALALDPRNDDAKRAIAELGG